jgi:hypothetical protein
MNPGPMARGAATQREARQLSPELTTIAPHRKTAPSTLLNSDSRRGDRLAVSPAGF